MNPTIDPHSPERAGSADAGIHPEFAVSSATVHAEEITSSFDELERTLAQYDQATADAIPEPVA